MSQGFPVHPTSRPSKRTLLVFALVTLGGTAAEAGHGHAKHRPSRRAPMPNPIFRTLDSVAGGLDLMVQKSLSSSKKLSQMWTGDLRSQACDELPCDSMLLDGLSPQQERMPSGVIDIQDESTWQLVPCEEDDQCDPRSLNSLPIHKGGLPFASDALQGPVELLPLQPVPRSPKLEAKPHQPDPARPKLAPPKAVAPPLPPELHGEKSEEDWFEEFSPSIPPLTPTAPRTDRDTSDPFRDDQPSKSPGASEIPTTDNRGWVEPVKERELQPRAARTSMPLAAPANRTAPAKKVGFLQPASRLRH